MNTHDMPPFAAHWRGDDIDLRVELDLMSSDDAVVERQTRGAMRRRVIEELQAEGLLRPGAADDLNAVLEALLIHLAGKQSPVLLINLEDLWLEARPQNVPGVAPEAFPSWRHRSTRSIEEIAANAEIRRLLDRLAAARVASSRFVKRSASAGADR